MIVSSTGALSLLSIPKKLLVVGAGIIGLEMVFPYPYPSFSIILGIGVGKIGISGNSGGVHG